MSALTPTRHGNWHVINGELVDLDQVPQSPATAERAPPAPLASDTASVDSPSKPAAAPRRKLFSTKE